MKKLVLLFALAAIVRPALSQTTVLDSLVFEGITRHVRVYIPASRKCSLILHLHGYGSTAATEQTFTNYMPVADTAGFIVAYPDGLKDNTGLQYWNVGWSFLPNTNDVGFLSALIDTLTHRYNIDPNAVFATGLSNGGFMCHKLACELSNKIAAIASISGSMTSAQYASCSPSRAVPVMEIHGTADMTVTYAGATGTSNSVNVDSVIARCAALAQCNPAPAHNLLAHNPATVNGSTVDHYVYLGGLQGATCELYKINGGAHIEWAGAYGNFDFDASREIWRFFRDYRVGNCTQLGFQGGVSGQEIVSCYPNPFSTDISIVIRKPGFKSATIVIKNSIGQTVSRTDLQDLHGAWHGQIGLGDFPADIYTLEMITDGSRTVRKIIKQ